MSSPPLESRPRKRPKTHHAPAIDPSLRIDLIPEDSQELPFNGDATIDTYIEPSSDRESGYPSGPCGNEIVCYGMVSSPQWNHKRRVLSVSLNSP